MRNLRTHFLCSFSVTLLLAFAASDIPALAANDFKNDGTVGTVGQGPTNIDWNVPGNWSAGAVPAQNQGDINITNVFLQNTTITNAAEKDTGSFNFLRIWSGFGKPLTASSNLTVVTSGTIATAFGFQIGSNSTLVVANTATFGSNQGNSFDLSNAGTLAISNGAKVFVQMNGDVTASAAGRSFSTPPAAKRRA